MNSNDIIDNIVQSWNTLQRLKWIHWAIAQISGGAHGVMVIVTGYGHSDTSSNPGRDWLHFT